MYSYASLCRALATTDAPQEEACLLLAHFCGVGRAELLCDGDRLYGNDALAAAVGKHRPDIIVPEIEAIRTERLYEFEKAGVQVVPSARAVNFTMNKRLTFTRKQ